ncbi:MAG TPA: CoA transferase, partial [Terriglobales bacterium]|nr:CoA transferase [Terriglobales bacterium]
MGLDADGLRRINPQAIFCQLDCFGGVRRGPRTDYLGYDDLVQAATGIMLRFGGSMKTPEEHAHVGTIDVMCGFGAALGVAAALYQKTKTGKAGRARTSLSALSGLAQIPFCYDYQGRPPFDEPSGPEARGYEALHRLYQAKDGWIVLAASERDLPRFRSVAGLEQLSTAGPDQRAEMIESVLRTMPAATWVERFAAADIGAAICDNIDMIRARSSNAFDGTPGTDRGSYSFSTYADHPSGHRVTQLDPYGVRITDAKIYAPKPAEKYGTSTRRVLSSLGYREDQLDELRERKIISESWSREYLPS